MGGLTIRLPPDGRLLHSAWPNTTDQRRTLILSWHSVFAPKPPSWWPHPERLPAALQDLWADEGASYQGTRAVNLPWEPRPPDYHVPWCASSHASSLPTNLHCL